MHYVHCRIFSLNTCIYGTINLTRVHKYFKHKALGGWSGTLVGKAIEVQAGK